MLLGALDDPSLEREEPRALLPEARRLAGTPASIEALRRGNVLVFAAAPGRELRALSREVAGPSDPALEAAGQAVLVERRPGTRGVVAVAARGVLRTRDASDPALRDFLEAELGRGAVR